MCKINPNLFKFMNDLQSKSALITSPCPICGGHIVLKHTDTVNPRDLAKKQLNENVYYKGVSYIFIGSISALCKLHGIPMGTQIGSLAKDGLEIATEKLVDIIDGEPQLMYFFEMRCSSCKFIVKRYYTTNVN